MIENKPEVLAALAPAKRGTKPAPTFAEIEEERAAIIEYDGHVPRDWAEGYTRLDPDHPLGDVPLRRWQGFVDDIGRFLDSPFCAVAAALGWSAFDLFGCDRKKPFARIDHMGLCWLIAGNRLVDLSNDAAVIETWTGSRQTYRRKPRNPDRVLAWGLVS